MGFWVNNAVSASPAPNPGDRTRRGPDGHSQNARPPISNVRSGHRFYRPALGRWLSRDWVYQHALYGLVDNAALDYYDVLGLTKASPESPAKVAKPGSDKDENPNFDKCNPTKAGGKQQIVDSREALRALCANFPVPKKGKCECLMDCVIDALSKVWEDNFIELRNPRGRPVNTQEVGGLWCHQWAAKFHDAASKCPGNDDIAKFSIQYKALMKNDNEVGKAHVWMDIEVDKKVAHYDDGFIDGDIAHFGDFPPPINRCRKHRAFLSDPNGKYRQGEVLQPQPVPK